MPRNADLHNFSSVPRIHAPDESRFSLLLTQLLVTLDVLAESISACAHGQPEDDLPRFDFPSVLPVFEKLLPIADATKHSAPFFDTSE